MGDFFANKRILVTGGCGTVGFELVRQLLNEPKIQEVRVIDNNESALFFLEERFRKHSNLNCFLGNVRDKEKLVQKMQSIDLVFHCAAFKHVILCEKSPFEAVQTNILGVQNIIKAAIENNVSRVILTSSDKAVNPTNVMGTSKLMGERLITAANNNQNVRKTIFTSTRFGNVLGSRGSVIPLFKEQIARGGPVTLTDEKMTRFIMTIEESVRLVIDSMRLAKGGEVFVTKMDVIRIKDLAEVMIEELAPKFGYNSEKIAIEIIGAKAGEKLYEELLNEEETRRTVELERYFIVLPAFRALYRTIDYSYPGLVSERIPHPYNSSTAEPISKEALRVYLHQNKLLEFTTVNTEKS